MLAKRVGELPTAGEWIFEPKWDGFRALVFRDGDEILIQSRDSKTLNRYFPELLEPLRAQLPARCGARRRNRHRKGTAHWTSMHCSFAFIPQRRG